MPVDLIRSTTAVIAAVFILCASCALRARLSAAIVTHARSGARFTIPSPLVVMTGVGGVAGACANSGTAPIAVRASVRARVFMTAPLVFRLKAEATGSKGGSYIEHATRNPIAYE